MKPRSFAFALLAIAGSMAVLTGSAGTKVIDSEISSAQTPPLTRPRSVTTDANRLPDLGPGASLHGARLFPLDNPWNQDISNAPIDPNSARLIASIGVDAVLHPD